MTKLVLENENGSYTAEVAKTEMTLRELLEEVLRPVLRAAGYHEDNINNEMGQKSD